MNNSIKKLTELFSQFPTIGQRTAQRFVFYLIKQPNKKIEELVQSLKELKNTVKLCNFCFNIHEENSEICEICNSNLTEKETLCVVETETDLESINKTKKYKGLYFVLGGVLGFKKTENDIRIKELKERIKNPEKFGIKTKGFSEIIIALNPVAESASTSILLEKTIREIFPSPDLKITHLARGLPTGGELEYADEETLKSAFEGRR